VFEVREVLRCWLAGDGLRRVAERAGVDRKTARRYVEAAQAAGLTRDGGEGQLSDGLVGAVVAAVRPARAAGHGAAWEALLVEEARIKEWIEKDRLQLTNIHGKLVRRGVDVPYRTLHRFATERCGFGSRAATVRVADGQPGVECQVDFGRLGLIGDPVTGRRRVAHALIFTAVYSRHLFVWLSFTQTLSAVIAGCEAAWAYFGGTFAVLIPDNMSPIVADADPINPTFTPGWLDYAQARGFGTDPARVRRAKDKPKVERSVQFVRENFFRGEDFTDLAQAQARVEHWCSVTAGLRVHGTTFARPAEVFAELEAPALLPRPGTPYDVPVFASGEGRPGPAHRGRQGAVLGARGVDRPVRAGPRRRPPGEGVLPRAAGQDPPPPRRRRPLQRPRGLPARTRRLRPARRRVLDPQGRPGRAARGCLRRQAAGRAAAVDADAYRLPAAGAGPLLR